MLGFCIAGTIQLTLDELYPSEELLEQYYYKDELSGGRLEICIDGWFHPVCDVSWNNQDASVVCRTLGFSPHGKYT